MNGARAKALRRQARHGAEQVAEMLTPAVKTAYGSAQSALANEKVTRDRVEALEDRVGELEADAIGCLGFRGRTLRERLRWLLRGR